MALNEREVEVLTWVARGKTSAEIGQILGLTKRTVDFHTDCARQTRRRHAHRSGDQSREREADRAVIYLLSLASFRANRGPELSRDTIAVPHPPLSIWASLRAGTVQGNS